jgi:[acyl-carrier-protein] S-malonyltransferase
MARLGIVFPGQGSQYVGMGRELFQHFAPARACFEKAQAVLDADIARLCFEGPREALDLTANTQVATFTLEMAAWKVLEERLAYPARAMAGHSLGEYSALCAAGALPFADTLRIIRARAAYQQEAVPAGAGANAAIQGLARDTVEMICSHVNAESGPVSPSCFNAQDQTVVSGLAAPVEKVMARALDAGAKRAVRLPLSAPFHCALLEGAARRLDRDFETVTFRDCTTPVIPNCDPKDRHSAATSRGLLVQQIFRPVRWQETIEQMTAMGIDTVIEVGPKRVLSVLVLRINKGMRVLNVENLESLKRTEGILSGKN